MATTTSDKKYNTRAASSKMKVDPMEKKGKTHDTKRKYTKHMSSDEEDSDDEPYVTESESETIYSESDQSESELEDSDSDFICSDEEDENKLADIEYKKFLLNF